MYEEQPRGLRSLSLGAVRMLNEYDMKGRPIRFDVKLVDDGYYRGYLNIVGHTPGLRKNVLLSGTLADMPGSNILVSYGLGVRPEHRGKGFSKDYQKAIERIAMELARTRIIAYIKEDNDVQHQRLSSLGWSRISRGIWEFRSQWFTDDSADNEFKR